MGYLLKRKHFELYEVIILVQVTGHTLFILKKKKKREEKKRKEKKRKHVKTVNQISLSFINETSDLPSVNGLNNFSAVSKFSQFPRNSK